MVDDSKGINWDKKWNMKNLLSAVKLSIRYKTGSIPGITEEYAKIPKKETEGHAEFANDIDYNGKMVNMLRFWEERVVSGEAVRADFQWLTSILYSGLMRTAHQSTKISIAKKVMPAK